MGLSDEELQTYIENAIDAKGPEGDSVGRSVFLVSELEVYCDMEGIDSFLAKYPALELGCAAALLRESGAIALSEVLEKMVEFGPRSSEELLDLADDLVSKRAGYDYSSLARAVRASLSRRLEKSGVAR